MRTGSDSTLTDVRLKAPDGSDVENGERGLGPGQRVVAELVCLDRDDEEGPLKWET